MKRLFGFDLGEGPSVTKYMSYITLHVVVTRPADADFGQWTSTFTGNRTVIPCLP